MIFASYAIFIAANLVASMDEHNRFYEYVDSMPESERAGSIKKREDELAEKLREHERAVYGQ